MTTALAIVAAFVLGALWERWNAVARRLIRDTPKPTVADVVALPKPVRRTVRAPRDDLPPRETADEAAARDEAMH